MEYKDINDYELLYLISDIQDDEVVYLLSKYEPFIQKKCNKWKMVLDKLGIEIEDLQQEIRIVFLEAIKNFKEEKNTVFYTYVSRIIDAKIKSLVRRMNSNKNIISSSCVSLSSLYFDKELEEFVSGDSEEVEKTVETLELKEKIYEFLYSLPMDKAFVFELYLNCYSVPLICEMLDVEKDSVRRTLRICRKKLKDYLHKFAPFVL